ncbi:type II secretion system protein GspD [Pseudoduganella violacea]|uniref:Type II secretory pathway component GspD/PulD (Secretin) n=1 Tax=Pseudoduganella violacea TaxID=1715466 RepID=A0A7W5FWS8_9BURK|nr:hypothetical protein [Pseudoduganella violacea]MBB3122151.1 type II secretory pathway component GspD/PulD (secretin) [Pseudoduganella violacea]
MNKKIALGAVLMALVGVVGAKPVTLDFNGVPVATFAQATFKALLRRDYVMAPELLVGDKKVSISISSMDDSQVPAFVEGVLEQQGISVSEKAGVYYLAMAKPAKESPELPQERRTVADMELPRLQSVRAERDLPMKPASETHTAVYKPANRGGDFLSSVLQAIYSSKAVTSAGPNVVLTGTASEVEKMMTLLTSVDTLPKLVDVSASWVEVTDISNGNRGISVIANVLGTRLGAQLGSVTSSSAISLRNTNFQLVIDALNTDNRFKQISNSRVVGDDYEKLVLIVGDETPTVGSTGRDNSGNSVQNIVYRPSGVIVDVTPKVLGNGRIRLLVDGQISNFKETVTGVTNSPTLIKRQVKTTVTIADGEVLLIGGLNGSQKSESATRWPFLPASWGSKSNSASNSDLVLVLSAKVANAD